MAIRRPVFFGWYVVAGCFLMAICSWGLGFYGPGVYLAHLTGARGWPVASVSFAITFYFWSGALLIMASGPLLDRLGPRRSTAIGTCATFAAVVAIARVEQTWQLYPAFALLAVGWATMSSAAINATLAPWFVRRRGLALSIALTGASFGGIVVVPLLTAAIRSFGFESGLIVTAAALCLAIVAVTMPLFVRAPALRGQGPDGDAPLAAGPPRDGAPPLAPGALPAAAERWGLGRVLSDRNLLTITLPFSIGLTAQVGVLTHLLAMLDPALGGVLAAWTVGLTTASAVAGRLVAGFLLDRLSRRRIAAGNFSVQILGLLLLAASTELAEPIAAIGLGCVLYGAGVGNMIAFPGLLVQEAVPPAQFARVTRLVTGIGQLSFATGPSLVGWIRQASGGYLTVLILCAALCLLSAVIVLAGRSPRNAR